MKYRPLTFVFADEDDMLRVLLLRRVLLLLGLLSLRLCDEDEPAAPAPPAPPAHNGPVHTYFSDSD
jgi:hypothetical protein